MKKIICFFTIFLLTLFLLFKIFIPTLSLNKKDIEIEVGTSYEEPGYKAKKIFKNLNNYVTVSSNIDENKIGEYKVTYLLKYKNKEYEKTRKVKVIDTEKPEIILKGEKTSYVCPNQKYEEEGFVATDNYDGIITDRVIVQKNKNKVTYSVKDSSGNERKITRKLIYKDVLGPDIKIYEEEKININSTYYEGNYKANDNCDGDISKNVKVEGKVDTNKEGTYTIKYTVSDSSNNTSIKYKKVIVGNFYKKTIYLTFDDGPSMYLTSKVLDVLKEKNVRATFFVIGPKIDALRHLVKREYDEGHAIGLHSYSHKYEKIYQSDEAFWNDIELIKQKVFEITGNTSKIIRFPGGSSNNISKHYNKKIMTRLTKEAYDYGYVYFDWNVSSGDAGGTKNSTKIYNNVISSLTDEANIVLMHDIDINTGTLKALPKIIDYALKNGYTFDVLTENTPVVHHTVHN